MIIDERTEKIMDLYKDYMQMIFEIGFKLGIKFVEINNPVCNFTEKNSNCKCK